jgi:hypothetical protein
VTADTTFLQCFVLEHEWAGLSDVTLEADAVLSQYQRSPAFDLLRQACSAAFDCTSLVWIVAICAAHLAFEDRMMVRHFKSRPHVQVTLETSVRRSPWINDFAFITATRDVQASGTVTGFAAHFLGVISRSFQTSVRRCPEITRDRLMTCLACLGSDEFRAGNAGRRENRAIRFKRAARKKDYRERSCSPDCPQQLLAFTAQPYDWPHASHVAQYCQNCSNSSMHFFGKSATNKRYGRRSMTMMSRAHCSIFGRRFSGQSLEDAIELRQRLKANRERDLANLEINVSQESACSFEAIARDIVDKLYSGYLFELFAQVSRIDTDVPCDLSQRDRLGQMFVDEAARLPDVARFGVMTVVRDIVKLNFGTGSQHHDRK